jgi:hypothetical protein
MASVLIKRRVLDHRMREKLGEPGGGMLPAGRDWRERVWHAGVLRKARCDCGEDEPKPKFIWPQQTRHGRDST